jgi:NTE family protein
MEAGMALALSGGGYRATLFHLGALWRLNEAGWLSRLDRISSISGGSITSGALAVCWKDLKFSAAGVATNFKATAVKSVRGFCTRTIDIPAIGQGVLLPWKRATDAIEEAYREHLTGDTTLQDLPDKPRFVFNATNFATGVSFRFSKPYAGDYLIGLIPNPGFRVSQAVAASTAFPPVLSPMILEGIDPKSFVKVKGARLYGNVEFRKRLVLTDGGVYDNLGLETVWNRYDTVLVSDGGSPFDRQEDPATWAGGQLKRVIEIALDQAVTLRKRALIADYQAGSRKGAYWGIGSEIAGYGLPDALPCPPAKTAALAMIRTRLNEFDEQEQCELINWGYAVSDAALRRWVDASLAQPKGWPYPDYALDRPR